MAEWKKEVLRNIPGVKSFRIYSLPTMTSRTVSTNTHIFGIRKGGPFKASREIIKKTKT